MDNERIRNLAYLRKKAKIKKIALITFVAVFCVSFFLVLYSNWGAIKPKFKDSIPHYGIITNEDGENFPLQFMNGTTYKADKVDNYFAVIVEGYLRLYDKDGNSGRYSKIDYKNPIMKTSNERILIYENSGTRFRVETRSKQVYQKDIEGTILFSELSDEGYVALVFQDMDSQTTINVFDDRGRLIYVVTTSDMICSVTFTADSKGLVAVYPEVSADRYLTYAGYYDFSSENVTKSTPIETFPYVAKYDNDKVFIAGKSACGYYNMSGDLLRKYTYSDTFLGYAYHSGKGVILLSNEQTFKYSFVIMNGADKEPLKISSDEPLKAVTAESDKIFILTSHAVYVYTWKGEQLDILKLDQSFNSLLRTENSLYLLSDNSILRRKYEQ